VTGKKEKLYIRMPLIKIEQRKSRHVEVGFVLYHFKIKTSRYYNSGKAYRHFKLITKRTSFFCTTRTIVFRIEINHQIFPLIYEYSRNSIGAPFSSIKATNTPSDGLLGSMIIFFPSRTASKFFTLKATCVSVFTSSGYGASAS
jgi:uncharacterized membrane protein